MRYYSDVKPNDMKNRIFFLLLFFVCLEWNAYAVIDIQSIHITSSDGLANNTIRDIFQDKKGFIWISTTNGLSRYDGHSFITLLPEKDSPISLADYHVKKIDEDKNGFLWVLSTSNVFSCYDLRHNCFVDFTGCGEHDQAYAYRVETANDDNWLWDGQKGCRKISFENEHFSSVTFQCENGKLPSNKVNSLIEDSRGNVWICTQEGLVKVTRNKIEVISDMHNFRAAFSYENACFFLADNGDIYVYDEDEKLHFVQRIGKDDVDFHFTTHFGTKDDWWLFTTKGSYRFHLSTRQVRLDNPINIPNARFVRDNQGDFYVFNQTGVLHYFQKETGICKILSLIDATQMMPAAEERYEVIQDNRGLIWISTFGYGLFVYNPQEDIISHYTYQETGKNLVHSNFLHSLLLDHSGNVWVGSEFAGVTLLSVLSEGSYRIYPEHESVNDYVNAIRTVVKMPDGGFWFGTRQGNVYAYDKNLEAASCYKMPYNYIYAASCDGDGKLWLGTRTMGLCIDGRWYHKMAGDTLSLAHENIFDIYRDDKNRMWIGTFGGGLNLAVSRKDRYVFRKFLTGSGRLQEVRMITQDNKKRLWVGTNKGLCVFYGDSIIADAHNYKLYNYENGDLPGYEIKCIFRDSQNRMWIGMLGGGFSVCNPSEDYRNLKFVHYSTTDGLVNNMVESIIEDKTGKIWIATQYGLSRFSPDTETFENFFFSASMQGNVYNEHGAAITEDGLLLFGTNHGVIVIDPLKVTSSPMTRNVILTNLKVNGITVQVGEKDSPLTQALSYTQNIKLDYDQNSFIIEFSTLDYSLAFPSRFIYKLSHFDNEWSTPSSLNFASYKNLSPGTYHLHVKACNSAGIWSDEETVLNIVITPPFWETTWAYLFYFLVVVIVLYVAFCLIRNFNNLRNRIQVETQLTEYKLMFFTNISHEFRTPLTMIQGALEKIESLNKIPKEMVYPIQLMNKSTNRMLRLINQLLEFRKMQNNKLSLMLEETDVMVFFYDIYRSFKETADDKQIDFHFAPSTSSYKMFVDQSKLDKIVYNLLSNALKYTPKGGKVVFAIIVNEEVGKLFISVSDNGVGIPKEKQGELFSRFMQSGFSHNSVGIGLHLTYELVNVHKGSISFDENEGGGSVFTVILPLDSSVYGKNDFLVSSILQEESFVHEQCDTYLTVNHDSVTPDPLNKKRILIIEDDGDVRKFLETELGIYFEIISEPDGLSGLQKAQSFEVDLIICDVLMPGMNGFDVTRKLKRDFETSHIPIILLTAMSTSENKLEGVESGADAYITKPFSSRLLLARIFQLIEQREKLKRKFSNDPAMTSQALCSTELDRKFGEKLQTILEKQLDNPEFTIEDFASAVGISRAAFFRKVKGVTGYTPNEYMRILRMKRAMELLQEGIYNVSEIAYKVGMNDPLYFSKCFKSHFGAPPSAYLHKK